MCLTFCTPIGIVEYEKKINLNSDTKRIWNHDLTSLDDKSWCDSHSLSLDTFGDVLAKQREDLEWEEDEETFEPQSDL